MAVLRLFLGKLFSDRQAWVLPVAAFAIVGTLTLLVAGGASSFWSITGELADPYLMLSVFALMLLVFPLAGLAGAASPPLIASARPLWRDIVGIERLRTAYALDSVQTQTTMVIGAPLPAVASRVAVTSRRISTRRQALAARISTPSSATT